VDLLAYAIPFFLLALLAEMAVDRWRGTGRYRANDAVNSLSTGTLMTTLGYFTKILPVYISGMVLANFALIDMPLAWFDASARGLTLWLVALLAWDFCYYWAHRMGHEISVLWAAHAVHHQSEDYNLSTALRQTSTSFLFSSIFYLPLFIIGFPLEVVATVNAIDLIYQFWVHTQHIGKLGWADRVFVTPSNHRVHHGQNEAYIDKNYGGIVILWDRLFGTFQEELDEHPVVYGVRKPLANWNPFWANLQVYDYLWFDARRTRRWRDKIGIWFRRTGWRPADVAEQFPKKPADLTAFRKYDPPVARSVKRYIIGQFVVGALAVLWIGAVYAEQGARAAMIPCISLWMMLYTVGLLNQGRDNAKRLELIRLFVVVPVTAAALLEFDVVTLSSDAVTAITAAYTLLSAGLVFLSLRPASADYPSGNVNPGSPSRLD